MTFGKSQRTLASIPSFRDQQRAVKRPPNTGGGGGGFYWATQLRLTDSVAGPADIIQLFRSQYEVKIATEDKTIETSILSFVPFVEHGTKVNGQFRSAICSAGPLAHDRKLREPCYGCDRHWEDKTSMSRNTKYGYTALHLHPYAKVPRRDRETNELKMNDRTNEPYYDWTRTSERQLRMDHKGFEVRDYMLAPLVLGYKDNETLSQWNLAVSTACRSCGGPEGSIDTMCWTCESCGTTLLNPKETEYSPDEILQISESRNICAHCRHEGYLVEEIFCSHCPDPVRADVYDVKLHMRQPKDTATGKRGGLTIVKWDAPAALDKKFLTSPGEGKPPAFHQLDLVKLFAPPPTERQEEIFSMGGMKADASKTARKWGTGAGKTRTLG